MKRKIFSSVIAAFAVMLQLAAQTPARAQFNATVGKVDVGGEMLYYQDNQPVARIINETLPAVLQTVFANEPFAPTANQAIASVIRLLNVGAFKAFAHSSSQIAPDTFVYKAFTLTDMGAESILIEPGLANRPCGVAALPANTRLAFKTRVNFGHIFDMVYAELKAASDPQFKEIAATVEQLKQSGIDIRQMCASVEGDVELLVTGTTLADAGIKVVVPDKNGSLSLILKQMIPPANGDVVARVPSPIGEIIVLYKDGKITATNQAKLLEAPAATIASAKGYQKLLKLIPDNGIGYLVIDIPGDVIAQVREVVAETPFTEVFDMLVKPVRLVSVFQVKSNGFYTVAVSNFSFYRAAQSIQAGAPALILLPALGAARERGRSVMRINAMKQIGTAVFMYANDHNDQLPVSLNQLDDYLGDQNEFFEGVIYFGSQRKLSQISTPSRLPLAVNLSGDQAVVLLADGHVESIPADNDNIVETLTENYSLDSDTAAFISKKINQQF